MPKKRSISESEEYDLDIEKIKRLIFDTYTYFSKDRENNFVLRKDLRIYKYINQFCCFNYYPNSWKASEFDTCMDFAKGLCLAIEGGFEAYGRPLLSLSYGHHATDPMVDMSSYESYEKVFEEEIAYFRKEYEEDA